MKYFRLAKHKILNYVLGILLPFVLFGLVLIINLPVDFAYFLAKFQLPHFLILIFFFTMCFRLKGRSAWIIGCSLTMVLFGLQLSSKWTLGITNANIIGGFIPYKDGFYYYNSAQILLSGQAIPEAGLQGAFRPLFPGMLSVLLLLFNNNLIFVIALVVALTAFCCFLSAFYINKKFGPIPAALLLVFLFSFIRPMIGYSLTEIPSLLFCCLAFILLLSGAEQKKHLDIVIGGLLLVIAISVRAGPFLVLPILIFWTGWIFRTGKNINLKQIIIYGLVFSAEFLMVNFIFPKLLTATNSSTFGNFSWMLYGQAVGGAGWSHHLEALGTHDSTLVMQAAIERLINYPLGFFIGAYKSFRDFLLPGTNSMFNLIHFKNNIYNYIFWIANILSLILGLKHIILNVKEPKYSLLLSIFMGTISSIPFLPPVDGGNRFYSGIAPFFFTIEAIGIFSLFSYMKIKPKFYDSFDDNYIKWVRGYSGIMIALILIAPIIVFFSRPTPNVVVPYCKNDQVPFATFVNNGSYVDILSNDSDACGKLPIICLEDFERNSIDKKNDDFSQKIVELARNSKVGIRLFATVDLISNKFNFTIFPIDGELIHDYNTLYFGCAKEIKTQFQTIHYVETINM
jgi:hypothetical protein